MVNTFGARTDVNINSVTDNLVKDNPECLHSHRSHEPCTQKHVSRRTPCGILAIEKPAGLLTHPNKPGIAHNSLLAAEYDPKSETYIWSEGILHLNNRLDSPTSGIVLASLGNKISIAVNELFRQKRVEKEYLAIVKGIPTTKKGDWEDNIARGRQKGNLRVSRGGGGIPARTMFEVLRTSRNESRNSYA